MKFKKKNQFEQVASISSMMLGNVDDVTLLARLRTEHPANCL